MLWDKKLLVEFTEALHPTVERANHDTGDVCAPLFVTRALVEERFRAWSR